MVTSLPGTGTLGCGDWCRTGTLHSWDIPPNIYLQHLVWNWPVLHLCPSYQSRCDFFFNCIVVRHSFNLIFHGSKWWLFYSLVVILMWLCKEASCVYLCCHLDDFTRVYFSFMQYVNFRLVGVFISSSLRAQAEGSSILMITAFKCFFFLSEVRYHTFFHTPSTRAGHMVTPNVKGSGKFNSTICNSILPYAWKKNWEYLENSRP